MIEILIAVGISLTVSILLTPALIRLFTRQGFGHEIREDGPPTHRTKRGTPSMGGVAILTGIWTGYLGSHLAGLAFDSTGPSASGLLVLLLATALGAVGFVDDLIKIRRARNLGLNKTAKTVGQITAAVLFGILVLQFRNGDGLTPGSTDLSYVREIATVTLVPVLFVLFCVVMVSAWSNAVNFTDGLDGLAGGCMAMVTAAYVLITFWQYRNACANAPGLGCYNVRDPLDLALVAAATAGACIGFLWWNAAPAKIFMGRHRIAGTGRNSRGHLGDEPHRDPRRRARLAVRGRDHLGRAADPGLPHHRSPGVPDGAVPPSLRARRLGRDHGDHPVLVAYRNQLRFGCGPVLQRVAGRDRRLTWGTRLAWTRSHRMRPCWSPAPE